MKKETIKIVVIDDDVKILETFRIAVENLNTIFSEENIGLEIKITPNEFNIKSLDLSNIAYDINTIIYLDKTNKKSKTDGEIVLLELNKLKPSCKFKVAFFTNEIDSRKWDLEKRLYHNIDILSEFEKHKPIDKFKLLTHINLNLINKNNNTFDEVLKISISTILRDYLDRKYEILIRFKDETFGNLKEVVYIEQGKNKLLGKYTNCCFAKHSNIDLRFYKKLDDISKSFRTVYNDYFIDLSGDDDALINQSIIVVNNLINNSHNKIFLHFGEYAVNINYINEITSLDSGQLKIKFNNGFNPLIVYKTTNKFTREVINRFVILLNDVLSTNNNRANTLN